MLHSCSGITVFTGTSRTAILHEEVLQDSSAPIPAPIPAPILHVHITLHYTTIQRILHPEIKFYMQKTKSSSSTTSTYRGQRDLHSRFQKRNSTHRRQGDLLEIHPCVPRTFQSFQSFQTFQTFQSFQSFQTFQSLQTLQRHSGHSSHS